MYGYISSPVHFHTVTKVALTLGAVPRGTIIAPISLALSYSPFARSGFYFYFSST
jgi:hypothetical protein